MAYSKARAPHSRPTRRSQPGKEVGFQAATSSRDRFVLVAIAVVVIGALGFLAFGGGDSGEGSAGADAEPGLAHVHGLGVDPGAETLRSSWPRRRGAWLAATTGAGASAWSAVPR